MMGYCGRSQIRTVLILSFLFTFCRQSSGFVEGKSSGVANLRNSEVSAAPELSSLMKSNESVAREEEGKNSESLLDLFKRGGGRPVGSSGSLPELRDLTASAYKAKAHEKLSGFLSRIGIKRRADRTAWLKEAQKNGIPLTLKKGALIKVYRNSSEKLPILLEFASTKPRFLTLDRLDSMHGPDDKAKIVIRSIGLEVERSLAEDAVRVGWGRQIVSKLADIFSWEVDLTSDIERGDSVKVVYEEIRRSWKNRLRPSIGDILAAEVEASGKKHVAIYFRNGKEAEYYNQDGEALGRPLLRYPLEFNSISSPFSLSRFHPRLRSSRPHFGVDFSAREGTPVRTIGDGEVVFAAWNGSYGRFVKIQHGTLFSSAYAHLKSIRASVKVGTMVQKGDEIGTMGSTGLSTGPHLHFALFKNDRYVDPFATQTNDRESIPEEVLGQFERAKNSLLARLEAISGP
jgi:murein DD-endopeptidase MepM/ murein hydrolase activator NlpD